MKKHQPGKYVKAKTPESIQKQKAAIVSYYVKKREADKHITKKK